MTRPSPEATDPLASRLRRNLTAARLVDAVAVAAVGQIAVDMPEGYFGPSDRVTPFGVAFVLIEVALVVALVLLQRRHPRLRWLASLVPSLNAGLFVPAITADPMVAGTVSIWSLLLVTQQLFPLPQEAQPRRRFGLSEVESRLAELRPAVQHLATVSLVLTTAVVGYELSGRLLAQGVCLLLNYGTLAAAWPLLRLLRKLGSRAVLAVALPAAGSLLAFRSPTLMLALLIVAQVLLLALLLVRQQSTGEILRYFYDRPSRLIVSSFSGAILIGTVLLTFPAASASGDAISPINALFTATSATCVTGLIVLDTPTAFSPFGQAVILGLIQVGGLGIMVLSTFAALMLGGTLGLKGETALTEILDMQAASTAYRLTRFIVLATLGVEAVGAAGLTAFFAGDLPLGPAAWRGVFHSVSAFCNAGFALQSDSVVLFQQQPAALLLIALLITLGGVGFVVLSGLWTRAAARRRRPLGMQVRVVLVAYAVLTLGGAAAYSILEWDRTLAGLPTVDRLVNALFQSVTLRTAGFNSVSFHHLSAATVLLMVLFMFIGAAPGSTGGGIKVTTAVVLLATVRSIIRGREPVTLFEREVPREIVLRSLAIVVISLTVVVLGHFALLLLAPLPFADLLFESVSAFGTVGLSLGATAQLGPAAKLVVVLVMFAGRIGPLTLALLLGTSRARGPRCHLPETRLMVG